MFPSTLRYIESLSNPEGLFRTLRGVRWVDGGLSSGNFGAVFKVETSGGVKAVKCFTRAQNGRLAAYREIARAIQPSKYIVEYRFLEQEIFVFDDAGQGEYYPVLVMDWVEGQTLTKALERAVFSLDTPKIEELAARFDELANWLLEQPFAHNDLKPDNIMVERDGAFRLIDYDGMFVPAMAGQAAREFGTEPFQSPNRRTAPFDANVDNYSIAYIRRALSVLSKNPERYCSCSLVDFTADELSEIEQNHTVFGGNYRFLSDSHNGIMSYRKGEKYGFITRNGVKLTAAVYDFVRDFTEDGLAACRINGKWGYINRSGAMVVEAKYDDCTDFAYQRAAVCLNGRWGYIDMQGRLVSPMKYDNAWSYRQGLALVKLKGRYGYLSLEGRVAISIKFDHAQSFTPDGLACVMVGEKYGYIDPKGKWWQTPLYDYAQSFRAGKATVEIDGRKFILKREQGVGSRE